MQHKVFTQRCEALLLSQEFQRLKDAVEFREPNLWHILRVSRREVQASYFLAWLLDPQAGHSFGDRFLKSLVIQVLQSEIGREHSLTPVDVLVMDLSNVQVATEHRLGARRCDVVAFSPEEYGDHGEGFVCIIENKIDAKESLDQTKDYYEASLVVFPSEDYPHRVCIYLSPGGDLPQERNFIPLSYQAVLEIVEALKSEPGVTDTERFLLTQFQENISRGIAMDPKTLDLAQAVYDQNQDVLEFIMQNVDRKPEAELPPPDRTWDGKSRFFNIGEMAGSGYRWDDCRKHGFICAGGGRLYRNWIEQFEIGDVIYAYVSGRGYVGIGTVAHRAVPFRDATLREGQRLVDLDLIGGYDDSEDDDLCDWIALVEWQYSVGKEQAVRQPFISRATTARVYEYRKDIIEAVRSELAEREH